MTKPVLTGRHFFYGNHACAEGALAAGCTVFRRLPHYSLLRNSGKDGKKITGNRWYFFADGR